MPSTGTRPSNPTPFERHYTVPELAQLWNIDARAVRRIFKNEPSVLRISGPGGRSKRSYTSYRIPESVAQRVYESHLATDATAGQGVPIGHATLDTKPPRGPYGEINMARRRGQEKGYV